jgi:hypothetical protein
MVGFFWLGFLMPTLPQGEHDLREQGGGHQLRPARGQRPHPDLQPRRLAAAGGAAPGPHPARQEGRARGRVQRLLLHARVAGRVVT